MSIFQLATVLIYVTSVLTSTVNDSSTPDPSPPSNLKELFLSPQTKTKDPTLLTDTRSVNDNGSTAVSRSEAKDKIFTEGGPVIDSSPKVESKSSTKPPDLAEDSFLSGLKVPSTSQETSGIVARKGVTYPADLDNGKSVAINLHDVKESSTTEMPVLKTSPIPKVSKGIDANNTPNDTKLDQKPEMTGNKTTATVILVPGHPNNTKHHKHKPTSTTGEGDGEGEGIPSSPTQTDIGMPRKVDYIIPVVITIMATPVLGIAAFVLYTRSKDCWEKRHYRRMDFLIDGMYND